MVSEPGGLGGDAAASWSRSTAAGGLGGSVAAPPTENEDRLGGTPSCPCTAPRTLPPETIAADAAMCLLSPNPDVEGPVTALGPTTVDRPVRGGVLACTLTQLAAEEVEAAPKVAAAGLLPGCTACTACTVGAGAEDRFTEGTLAR